MSLVQHAAFVEPEVDDFGAPDIFATGWIMGWGAEVITGISYIERMERGVIRRQVVCRVHYPRSRWMAAFDATMIGMRGEGLH